MSDHFKRNILFLRCPVNNNNNIKSRILSFCRLFKAVIKSEISLGCKNLSRDFVGYGPLTAPESVALYNFTLQHNFRLMITYHTQGRVIYYKYEDRIEV